ncbi:MAG: sigma-70 family RNA polymerase sigma factor [Planctomycetes bacterium]|nr:sigma-70 family RNA polymerase sigma factor [Planctomycetota bacterium]
MPIAPPHHPAAATPADDSARRTTAAIAAGDPRALSAFYEEWFDRCLAIARAATGRDESFCLDAVQNAMLRVARSIPILDSAQDLHRWMSRVVYTAALDLLKSERRRAARERAAHRPDHIHTPDRSAQHADEIAHLCALLRELPEPHRRLLDLRLLRGFTNAATAREAGTTDGAAHGHVRRILASLRRLSGHEGDHR